jgi:hypothetical protein
MIKDLNFQALYQCAIILYDDLLDFEVNSSSNIKWYFFKTNHFSGAW